MGFPSLRQQLYSAVLDTLEQQICVMNKQGDIIYVNRSWIAFGLENSGRETDWLNTNYLAACNMPGNGDTTEVIAGIRRVLDGEASSFNYEYPCNSPDKERWFLMQMHQLAGQETSLYVISHLNITQRKLAEDEAEYLSTHDPLTGLYNRRHFENFFASEWHRNLRNRTPISLVMFDLDHFKQLNDQLGHVHGDDCLLRVAHIIRDAARRADDIAVRWGGEEFILLLGNTAVEAAMSIAEGVRLQVQNLPPVNGVKVTISAGIASAIPDGPVNHNLISIADKALYQAKQNGRNAVVSADMLQ